jgi:phosphatidylglycerophosphate synthase
MTEPVRPMHVRRFSSLTAEAEKRLLLYIAKRLPLWFTPNRLTLIGVSGGALIGLGFAFSGAHPAVMLIAALGYVVNWFGDSLDGTVARVRGIERPRFGMFVDQSADLLMVFLALAGMAASPYLRLDVALAIFASYLLLAVFVHLRANVTGVYDVAHGGIGPTEGRIIMIFSIFLMVMVPPFNVIDVEGGMTTLDVGMLLIVVFSFVTCVGEFWRVSRSLAREEPPRTPDRTSV